MLDNNPEIENKSQEDLSKIDPRAIKFFEEVIRSPHIQALSALYERHSMEGPALENLQRELDQLKQAGENIPPELLSFMIHFVDLNIGAMGAPRDNESEARKAERQSLSKFGNYLRSLADGLEIPDPESSSTLSGKAMEALSKGYERTVDFLHGADPNAKLPHPHRLPDHQRHLLKAIEHHTGQGKTRPVKGLIYLTLATAEHILEEVNENRKGAAVSAGLFVALLLFMRERIGVSPPMYIDPKDLAVSNLSLDSISGAALDAASPGKGSEFMPEFADKVDVNKLDLPWHDHLAMLVGNDAANWARDHLPGIEYLSPKHAAKLLDFASTAQNSADWLYVNFFARMMSIIGAPAQDLGDKAIPDSPFKQAFLEATRNAEKGIVAYNVTENLIFHSLVLFMAWKIAHKTASMTNEEMSEHMNIIKNFIHRTLRTSPMTYAAAIVAGTYAYVKAGGFDPSILWMGVLAATGAEMVHKLARKFNRSSHLEHLNPVFAVADDKAFADMPSERAKPKGAMQKIKGFLGNKFTLFAGGATAGLIAADWSFNQGVGSGTAGGYGFVIVPYLLYDLVEDNLAHVIFACLGAAGGYVTGTAKKAELTSSA